MGKRIKIITDSTCYISKEDAEKNDITVVPLKYIFDDVTYEEGYAGEFDEYFIKLRDTELFPTTSQPSTGELLIAFEEALKEYDKVIGIFLSSKLSGTYNNAVLVKEMLENENIAIIDSNASVASLRFMVEDASNMAKNGVEFEEIVKHIEKKKEEIQVYLTTESLEYLSRGGRLSTLEYKVGNVLKIKPIVELREGQLNLIDKVRGRKKAINKIIGFVDDNVKDIRICHILNHEEALVLKDKLEKEFPNSKVSIEEIGPVIGSHLGPETIGICFY